MEERKGGEEGLSGYRRLLSNLGSEEKVILRGWERLVVYIGVSIVRQRRQRMAVVGSDKKVLY